MRLGIRLARRALDDGHARVKTYSVMLGQPAPDTPVRGTILLPVEPFEVPWALGWETDGDQDHDVVLFQWNGSPVAVHLPHDRLTMAPDVAWVTAQCEIIVRNVMARKQRGYRVEYDERALNV